MSAIATLRRSAGQILVPIVRLVRPYRYAAFNLVFSRFCNAACRMCVKTHFDDKVASRVYLDQATLTAALGQLKSMGARDISVFPMGEPLVHPRFSAFIDQIVGAGFRVVFSTNGELVKPKHHAAIAKAVDIGYSIEGYDEPGVRHYRGVSFDKVMNGLVALRQALADKPMTLRTTLYRAMDADYLESFMATWAPFFDKLVVTPATPPHLYHSAFPPGVEVSPDEFYAFQRDPERQCRLERTGVAILPNGDVSECTEDYSARFIFGNINTTHLRDILESRELAEFRARARTNTDNVCGDCAAYFSLVPEHRVQAEAMTQLAHGLFVRYQRGTR